MSNIPFVRELLGAMAEGRLDDALDFLSDEIHWEVAGDLAFCGPHVGKRALRDNLFAVIDAHYVPGTAKIEILDMFEDVARSLVITQIAESADVVGGGRVDAKLASFFFIVDGKVAKVQEFVDLRPLARMLDQSSRPALAGAA